MTIKSSLLSITAIVKRFQTEKNLSPPEWEAPLPTVEFRNRMWYRKP